MCDINKKMFFFFFFILKITLVLFGYVVLNYSSFRLSVVPSFSLVVMAFLFFGQVAFKTGDYKQQVIFIGGLTDGFLATEYVL